MQDRIDSGVMQVPLPEETLAEILFVDPSNPPCFIQGNQRQVHP